MKSHIRRSTHSSSIGFKLEARNKLEFNIFTDFVFEQSNTDFRDAMLSMGKTLIEQKKSDSQSTTFQQRKELVVALVQWTKTITILVKTAVELRVGKSMDISKLGLDVDVNSIVGSERIETSSSNITTGGHSNVSTSGSVTTTRSERNTKTGSNNHIGVSTETGSPNIKNGSQNSGLSP